jgi:ATP-dependent DNA helicase RecQ
VAAEDLRINEQQYGKRKEAYAARVQQIIAYIKTTDCRSIVINTYFGDSSTAPCGTCDNCRRSKNNPLSTAEFERIYGSFKSKLAAQPLTATDLLQDLNGVQKEKAWQVICFLQAEKKLYTDAYGRLTLPGA